MSKDNPSNYGKLGMKELMESEKKKMKLRFKEYYDTEFIKTEEWYCVNCGTAQKGNTTVGPKTKDRILTCSDCEIVIRFYIVSPAKKTVAEAIKSFEATPLTDRQATGRANTGKSKRKRKRK
jgi:transcription elongation factor Elf1